MTPELYPNQNEDSDEEESNHSQKDKKADEESKKQGNFRNFYLHISL